MRKIYTRPYLFQFFCNRSFRVRFVTILGFTEASTSRLLFKRSSSLDMCHKKRERRNTIFLPSCFYCLSISAWTAAAAASAASLGDFAPSSIACTSAVIFGMISRATGWMTPGLVSAFHSVNFFISGSLS